MGLRSLRYTPLTLTREINSTTYTDVWRNQNLTHVPRLIPRQQMSVARRPRTAEDFWACLRPAHSSPGGCFSTEGSLCTRPSWGSRRWNAARLPLTCPVGRSTGHPIPLSALESLRFREPPARPSAYGVPLQSAVRTEALREMLWCGGRPLDGTAESYRVQACCCVTVSLPVQRGDTAGTAGSL